MTTPAPAAHSFVAVPHPAHAPAGWSLLARTTAAVQTHPRDVRFPHRADSVRTGSFFAELKRRNVLRAAVLYAGAVWAFGQGLSQFSPSLGLPDWTTRWFLVAASVGFPFWIAFAWFYEFTPSGFRRESEIARDDSIARSTGRKLDFWIIGILAVAVVLLLTDRFFVHEDVGAIVEKSIAVLPLANQSGDKDQQYFSDGLSEDLIVALSQFGGLKVIGRNSAFQFRDSKDDAQTIGRKLGVLHLLEGSVRREGDVVRISAELINTADASTLWSQHYDRPYKDLFALQDDITRAVASALQAKLLQGIDTATQSDRPPGGDLDAYTAYLQGKFHEVRNTEQDQRTAIDKYTLALRLDPRYALADARLSNAWTVLGAQFLAGAQQQLAYASARAAATSALGLEPGLAQAHVAQGYLLLNADLDLGGAEAAYSRALQFAPDDASATFQLGNLQAALGRPQQAVELTRLAFRTDPLHASWHLWLATYLTSLGRLDEAEHAIRKAIELQPAAVGFRIQLAAIAICRGDAAGALDAARQEPTGVWRSIALGLALQIGTDRTAADAALKTLIDEAADQAPYQIAEVYALRRDPDQMFAWLERARTSRDPGLSYLLTDPFILRYQHDPRFAAICQKVGLPTTTAAVAMP